MLTVVPVPDHILESSQFSTCTELPLLHQLHGGLPLPLSHAAVVEVLKLCAGAGPLGKGEVEAWKGAVLGLTGGGAGADGEAGSDGVSTVTVSDPTLQFKPKSASLPPAPSLLPLPIAPLAPVTTVPAAAAPPTPPTPGVPLGARSPALSLSSLASPLPAPAAPRLRPALPVRDTDDDLLGLSLHGNPRVPAHLSHTPPPSAHHANFADALADRLAFAMDDYGAGTAGEGGVPPSPAVPVLELGPRATQASLGGFVPLSCAPEVDPAMARKLALRARERSERERAERERELAERAEREQRERAETEQTERAKEQNPRDIAVDALLAA